MGDFKTPLRTNKKPTNEVITIPPSPLLKKLGYGTGVSVYKMERSPLCDKSRSPWAVKKLNREKMGNPELGKRLTDEASVLRKLNHPNVIGFRAFIKDGHGKDCLAMEECNVSLGDLIEKRNLDGLSAFPSSNIMKVALDIVSAMDYLHNTALILHCDIKSYNILVKGDFDMCKLCDFGVSLPLNKNGSVDSKVCNNDDGDIEYSGSLSWSAPEVLNGENITTKVDIFSYGLVLWEMLALIPPPPPEYEDSISLETSTDSSEFDLGLRRIGSRPELPPQDFGDDYQYVLILFHCCTEEDPVKRPKASDLVSIVEQMIQYKANDETVNR